MKAAIYARYSSENQRPESIEDQVRACRMLADERGLLVDPAWRRIRPISCPACFAAGPAATPWVR
jgi:hypothetical protein